jgi:alanine racemase
LTSTLETVFSRLHLPDVLRPAWTEIDLAALTANLRLLRGSVAPAKALAVIKADAYGHGAVDVANLRRPTRRVQARRLRSQDANGLVFRS